MPDSVVSACDALDGVSVLWISRYAAGGNLFLDLEVVEALTADPATARDRLVDLLPIAFRVRLGRLRLHRGQGRRARTDAAPDTSPFAEIEQAVRPGVPGDEVYLYAGAAPRRRPDRHRPPRRPGVPRLRAGPPRAPGQSCGVTGSSLSTPEHPLRKRFPSTIRAWQRSSGFKMADVAQAAGVSVATVSKVVNGHYGVSKATLTKVLGVIDLGYETSLGARSLRSHKTNVIGVLVAEFEPFSTELLKGVSERDPRHRLRAAGVLRRPPRSGGRLGAPFAVAGSAAR